MPFVGKSRLSRVSNVSAGRMLDVKPSLKRFASGKLWKRLTALDVPKNVVDGDVETLSTSAVYVIDA